MFMRNAFFTFSWVLDPVLSSYGGNSTIVWTLMHSLQKDSTQP